MASNNSTNTSAFRTSLHGLPYTETVAQKPPVRVKTSTSPRPVADDDGALRDPERSPADLPPPKSPASAHFLTTSTAASDTEKESRQKKSRGSRSGSGSATKNGLSATAAPLKSPSSTIQFDSQTSLPTTTGGERTPISPASTTFSIPQITFDHPPPHEDAERKSSFLSLKPTSTRSRSNGSVPQSSPSPTGSGFKGLTLDLTSSGGGGGGLGGFADELNTDSMRFSKRGSMLMDGGGKKVVGRSNTRNNNNNKQSQRSTPLGAIPADNRKKQEEGLKKRITIADQTPVESMPRQRPTPRPRPAAKTLTVEEEGLSEKVRSFYAIGSDIPSLSNAYAYDSDAASSIANKIGNRWQDSLGVNKTEASSLASLSRGTSATDIHSAENDASRQNGNGERRTSSFQREENELAGGIEDWQDVENADVDRYGFIIPKQDTINNGKLSRSGTAKDRMGIARVTTSLQLATEQPRRKGTVRRTAPGSSHGTRSMGMLRSPSEKSLKRPQSSPGGGGGGSGGLNRNSTFRSRDQKAVDQAGDMLTLPRTASMLIGTGESASEDPRARRKEIEREEKWRKMARPVHSNSKGGGMTFEFDTKNSKLIERTWKGIPDKWRASAWHAFLSASARKNKESLSDEDLIAAFDEYQAIGSPDDVQIDIDVPRTISSHIMFRRRYRGGQRLLFRVLHAMSLHFADTGYVQGMAALAATLLAYYEEEKAFVMLVRLWEERGLGGLYGAGFGGLMKALDDFEKKWLSDGELAKKLEALGVGPTAYGTRWYLTLFNYSIPFPAQLRVWDVFMLLGDDNDDTKVLSNVGGGGDGQEEEEDVRFGATLDVLHATSAALIDGMRDILMESDFENCMKVLTSWIPIKDEDMLMRVAKAEWKTHRQKLKG